MTANAGYHAYATGDVLTAAQVQYNLQNQTVMYFATTTARDAALTGAILVEGLVTYTPATKMMYYNGSAWVAVAGAASPLTTKGDVYGFDTAGARIPIGSNNQVLTADSTQALGLKWANPSTGSMTLLSTTTLSGLTTTVSGISQSYKDLYVQISNAVDTLSAIKIDLQFNGTADQVWVGSTAYAGSATTNFNSDRYLSNTTQSSNNSNNSYGIYVRNYSQTVSGRAPITISGQYQDNATAQSYAINLQGARTTTTAITSLVVTSSSNVFTGGSIYIYGVN